MTDQRDSAGRLENGILILRKVFLCKVCWPPAQRVRRYGNQFGGILKKSRRIERIFAVGIA
ncbi:hypothetical protein [Allobaculum sp. Allo2]|uniref:hypothetical protein n=1 Tax=Allobaculum sp. Allo2 TaxID=2853432 RepID=UPI001F61EA8A|nr:hypothetical protein [Allobaculum sp. Allo2]UNT92473.1 hypothetical protein KWG61_09875 [Allobaculum sp. Allo2]